MVFQFPVASGEKKQVQVFVCPVETWKERKPRRNANDLQAKDDAVELTRRQEIRKEFDDAFESVLDFTASKLKGKEKKQHEAQKIESLGGKAAANRRVPYKVLIGMRTKGAARKQRRENLMKESDVLTGKRRSKDKAKVQQKGRKTDFGLQATKGRFKGGVLDVRGL
ncbi:unnamed protein product [Hyaloperonospora brassicae]|uniref:Sas10 C-terminal domain-containing protein n=1 Tax=Hyaloperonospora brassicae TaxID=162125 RepID=A0AAV0T0N8_HYABA|nr:unnamed protein product [Hyaloperonospora brassicae]